MAEILPSSNPTQSISHVVLQIQKSIDRITLVAGNENHEWHGTSLDTGTRFRIWAGNLGAYQSDDDARSAAFRLRNAPEIATRIVQLLKELQEAFDDIAAIISGEREGGLDDLAATPIALGADESGPQSEISELWLMAEDVITSLMKISVLIRSSTRRNRFEHTVTAAAKYYPLPTNFDISHVREKHPKLEQTPALLRRLGEAITQRRQYLKYANDYDTKISTVVPKGDVKQPDKDSRIGPSTMVGQTIAGLTIPSTKASVLTASQIDPAKPYQLNDFDGFDNQSNASTAVSYRLNEDNVRDLDVVPMSKLAPNGGPFQCVYCRGMVMFANTQAWRTHVFSDLRAYGCTFEDCSSPMFTSRRAWTEHEKAVHRRSWKCTSCGRGSFKSQKDMLVHMKITDPSSTSRTPWLSKEIHAASSAIESLESSLCPFCDDWRPGSSLAREDSSAHLPAFVSINQFERHVGRHLEQLALFAIPPSVDDEDEEIGSRSSRAIVGTESAGNLSFGTSIIGDEHNATSTGDDRRFSTAPLSSSSFTVSETWNFELASSHASHNSGRVQPQRDGAQSSLGMGHTESAEELTTSQQAGTPPLPDPHSPKALPDPSKLDFCRVLYDYNPQLVQTPSHVDLKVKAAEISPTMAKPRKCEHTFKMIKSDTTLILWSCNMCHSGPHWFIYECAKCKLKTCRPCSAKA